MNMRPFIGSSVNRTLLLRILQTRVRLGVLPSTRTIKASLSSDMLEALLSNHRAQLGRETADQQD
jgi:hypothetical protein